MTVPPARYFPVDRRPLHMRPRLKPFPTDLGNGDADGLCFQRDEQGPHYLAGKHPERYRIARGPLEDRAHEAVLGFMESRLAAEQTRGGSAPATANADRAGLAARYEAIAASVQEDFTVHLREADGRDRAIGVYVSFPSSWRPERILGWSFRQIHEPVPDFADADEAAASLVAAMVERGPYLRFVWTVCADDALDHHPDAGLRRAFESRTREGWLRIERQLTIPFPEIRVPGASREPAAAALFLIRTYLRSFQALDAAERSILADALRRMPASTARYKGLDPGRDRAIALLEEPRADSATHTV